MLRLIRDTISREAFLPSRLIGIWTNPMFIVRRGLYLGIREICLLFKGGKLLDLGCGSKPYESLFSVDEYIGIDIEASGHDHSSSQIDRFYDGKTIPFDDEEFDYVFSSEVIEHIFNLDEILDEVDRVLKPNGLFMFTCPFVWEEHEQPYDYARYTSFALHHLLEHKDFLILKHKKTGGYLETVFQMLSLYIHQNVLPRNKYFRLLCTPLFITPLNLVGIILGRLLPASGDFYLNHIVVARKK